MTSWLEPPRARRRPVQWKAALSVGLGLATFLAMPLTLSSAQAQYGGWREGYDYDGPEPYYPGYPDCPNYRPNYPDRPRSSLSLADIRQKVAERGMHLVATPRRKGRIYLAETEDARGIRHRLVFDAFAGRLIENTVLGPKTPVHTRTPQRPQADAARKIPGEAAKGRSPADRPLPDPADPQTR